MKDNNHIKIEKVLITSFKKNVDLQNEISELKNEHTLKKKEVFLDILLIVDAFERAETTIQEKGWNKNENNSQVITRLLIPKQRALSILEKNNVTKMTFADNLATDDYCKTIETEPNSQYPNNYILSIEKNGYVIDNEFILRKAEVIVVRN